MHRIPVVARPDPAAEDRRRRLIGLGLGALLGLVYAAVSQGVNHVALPGIPLYQPPLGYWGNLGLSGLWGGVLGLVVAWPYGTSAGVVAASVLNALVTTGRGMLGIQDNPGRLVVAGLFLGVPVAILTLPVMAMLRWAVNGLMEVNGQPRPLLQRWRRPLNLVLITAAVAVLSLYHAQARTVLQRTDEMLRAGLAAADQEALPDALRRDAGDFLARASNSYTLEWTEADLDRFIELRPATNYSQHSAVIARFDNGWTLVCLYPTADSRPNCRAMAVPKANPARPLIPDDA